MKHGLFALCMKSVIFTVSMLLTHHHEASANQNEVFFFNYESGNSGHIVFEPSTGKACKKATAPSLQEADADLVLPLNCERTGVSIQEKEGVAKFSYKCGANKGGGRMYFRGAKQCASSRQGIEKTLIAQLPPHLENLLKKYPRTFLSNAMYWTPTMWDNTEKIQYDKMLKNLEDTNFMGVNAMGHWSRMQVASAFNAAMVKNTELFITTLKLKDMEGVLKMVLVLSETGQNTVIDRFGHEAALCQIDFATSDEAVGEKYPKKSQSFTYSEASAIWKTCAQVLVKRCTVPSLLKLGPVIGNLE